MTLRDLLDRGWVAVDPPKASDGDAVIARYKGDVIKAGVLKEMVRDDGGTLHTVYSTGPYEVELKLDSDIPHGQLRVRKQ